MASIKDLKRLCSFYIGCIDCPIKSEYTCSVPRFPDNADEIVDKWVQEHPVKTYAMDFFSKFPNTPRDSNGVPKICWAYAYGGRVDCSPRGCTNCWNQEVKEDG